MAENVNIDRIREELVRLSEPEYRAFMAPLLPGIEPDTVLGVRTPALKQLAKQLSGTEAAAEFMHRLPHEYFDENQLHAFLLGTIRDFDVCIDAAETFLPFVDNWATCDQLSPKVFGRRPELLLPYVRNWLESGRTYTVRFGTGMLMRYFLDSRFDTEYPKLVLNACARHPGEYYVEMMTAWYFATALAKQYKAAVPYLEQRRLSRWVHNKTIQKAVESRRIEDKTKDYLKSLRWYES